jgi:ribose 5-phosphate isomerase B
LNNQQSQQTHIYIASDHAGLEYKNEIVQYFLKLNLKINNLGPNSMESVDYPDFADLVCQKLKNEPNSFGILICGSGQGMALRANKFQHIRAALVYSDEITKLAREHNNANVICLGSRFCSLTDAQNWITLFLNTKFSEGRHAVRVAKISGAVNN